MKRFSAYATTVLTASLLAVAGCSGHNNDDQGTQPGASTPAAPNSAPAAAPPPSAPSPTSSTLPPASHTSPSSSSSSKSTPAPATTAAH